MKLLEKKLKLLMGKQLSADERERAIHSEQPDLPIHLTSPLKNIFSYFLNRQIACALYAENDCLARRLSFYRETSTRDVSDSSRIHTGHYWVGDEVRRYNSEGLLVEREVQLNHPAGAVHTHFRVTYEPPGCFFGKKERFM